MTNNELWGLLISKSGVLPGDGIFISGDFSSGLDKNLTRMVNKTECVCAFQSFIEPSNFEGPSPRFVLCLNEEQNFHRFVQLP